MMKQIYKILFLIILISCEQKKEISPIFYEVKGENCKVYILGSIHSSDGSIFPLPKFITDRFNECGKFLMELKPLEIDTSLSQDNVVVEGYNLKEHVSYETLQLVNDISKAFSIPNSILLSLKPQQIIQLVEKEELRNIGITSNKGIESYFYYLSKERNITIDGFETYAEVLENFKTIDSTENERRLIDYLSNRKTIAKETKQLLEFWKHGNEKGLLEKMEWFSNNYPGFAKKILFERNQKISSKILKIMENTETVFITIGAGHLIGEDNIIDKLKKKDFSIKKIEPAP